MKIFHTSDLHIGKQLNYYDLKEVQQDFLDQIKRHLINQRPDALLLCGDIYDKSVPSGEAQELFNQFLEDLSEIEPQIPVLIISGNHDSRERLHYASAFLERSKIYIAAYPPRKEDEQLMKITLEDDYGPVNFYLLPFVRPGDIRSFYGGEETLTYDRCVRYLIEREEIDLEQRNVLLSHQFYVNGSQAPEVSDSEQMYLSVGGLDSVDVSAIEQFDYVALGHIHKEQQVRHPWIRYSGTPYKYSVSEAKQKKCMNVVELKEKGTEITIRKLPFTLQKDVRTIRGGLQEVLDAANEQNCHDFVSITLTDDLEQYHRREKLQEYYDHILDIQVESPKVRQLLHAQNGARRHLDPFEAFTEFYRQQQDGKELQEEQIAILKEVIAQSKGGEE